MSSIRRPATPEGQRAREGGKIMQGQEKLLMDQAFTEAKIRQQAQLTDDVLWERAESRANEKFKDVFPVLEESDRLRLISAEFDDLKSRVSAESAATETAYEEALGQGLGAGVRTAILNPEQQTKIAAGQPWEYTNRQIRELMSTEGVESGEDWARRQLSEGQQRRQLALMAQQYGAPPKQDPTSPDLLTRLVRTLETGQRAVQGAAGGLLQKATELTSDQPISAPTEYEHLGYSAASPFVGMEETVPRREVTSPRVGGVPVVKAAGELITHPVQSAEAALKGAVEGVTSAGRPESNLGVQLQGAQQRYRDEAQRQAMSELKAGTISEQQLEGRAEQIFQDYLASDLTAANPNLVSGAVGMGLDPVNFLPVGKVLGAAGKAAAATKPGRAVLSVGQAATKYFRRDPGLDPLNIGTAAEKEAASIARLARDEAASVPHQAMKLSGRTPEGVEFEKLDEYLSKSGHITKIEETGGTAAQKIAERLKKEGSVDYEVIDSATDVGRAYKHFTGNELPASARYIMPKPIADRVRAMMPVVGNKADSLLDGINKVNESILRPAQQVWRRAVTQPKPSYTFYNMVSAPMLGFLAHGFRAANPSLQGGALRTVLPSAFGGAKRALNVNYTLKSGETKKLGELVDIATQFGIIEKESMMLDDLSMKGPVGRLVEKVDRFNPVSGANRRIDNYQRMVAFLGALEDTSIPSIAKAVDFSSKFAGNMKRMGKADQIGRDLFAFYGWQRFIFPLVMTQLVENPQRLAAFAKLRTEAEQEWGKYAPVTHVGVPKGRQAFGFTAPPWAQTDSIQKFIKTGEVPRIGSHEFAMATLEEPLSMGLGVLSTIQNTVDMSADERASLVAQLGPIAAAVAQFVTKKNLRTGQPIDEFAALPRSGENFEQLKQRTRASAVGAFGESFLGGLKPYADMYRLYADNGMMDETARMYTQYAVGSTFLGLDNLVMEALGKEGRSKGGAFSGGFPGMRISPVQPEQTANKAKKQALEYFYERKGALTPKR